uniref:Uncharacterized protein n=1 Tax=Arundo donax TaxID=35708 RepID=A0A0A8XSK3_ARUDO
MPVFPTSRVKIIDAQDTSLASAGARDLQMPSAGKLFLALSREDPD